MTGERLELIKQKLSSFSVEYQDVNGTACIVTTTDKILEICTLLKDDTELGYDMLLDEVGMDNFTKSARFEVICNLYSTIFKDRLFLKVIIPDPKNPVTPSLAHIWKSADWYEREVYDMFGIIYENHPDLRRVYMPDEFEYFPLRKDFPTMGIPGSISLPNK
ncbi:NADH-quinone oxidoreductase subunit C [bacterium]|nr:MAG: NADH-quinone oxidoreductase subunit C [bacterium]